MRLLVFLEATTVTGPAKNLLQFASLARHPHNIETTVAVFRRAGDSPLFQAAAAAADVPVIWIEERGRFDRAALRAMQDRLQELRPDIIQTHAVKGHFLARWAGLPRQVPWVAFHHGYTWTDWRVRLYNQLDRWSLRAAQKVVTVSQPFAAELCAMGVERGRIHVVHNAIDPDWGRRLDIDPAALRQQLGIPTSRKVILIVGRLSLEKDHLALVEAVSQLHQQGQRDTHMLVVGEGPERGRIEAAAAKHGLTGHLTLTGHVSSAEPYYRIADVAVLSSRTEGSPNALLEAMAAGIPVVATRVGGIPEIVTDQESALLVPAGDVARLTAALGEVLRDPALARRLVETSLRLVKQQHAPAVRIEKLAELYRELHPQSL